MRHADKTRFPAALRIGVERTACARLVGMDEAAEVSEIKAKFGEAGKLLHIEKETDGTFTASFFSATAPGVRDQSSQAAPAYTASSEVEAARLAWAAFTASP